jgi:hypothetical protein
MTLADKLIIGFLLHLVGDYLLQNDWMATNKTKDSRWNVAIEIHTLLYSLPFLLITDLPQWLFLVYLTHYFIDRYCLAQYWIKLVNWNWKSKNYGFADDKPAFMSIWLLIIIDNVFHILFNSLAIYLSL